MNALELLKQLTEAVVNEQYRDVDIREWPVRFEGGLNSVQSIEIDREWHEVILRTGVGGY